MTTSISTLVESTPFDIANDSKALQRAFDEIFKWEKEDLEHAQGRTNFQIEKFIIGKEHSFHGRMWQCMREIETRYDSLVNINFEIENQKDDIILKKIENSNCCQVDSYNPCQSTLDLSSMPLQPIDLVV
jgi:hypothetical protein